MSDSICSGPRESGKLDLSASPVLPDDLPILVVYIDRWERHVHANSAYETFFGRPAGTIAGKSIAEVAGPEFAAIAGPYIARALAGEHVMFLSSIRHPDGILRDVEVSYTPDVGDDGQVLGFVSIIRSLASEKFLGEARARLAAIVDSSDDAIVSKTFDGVITSWNRSAERIFGYTAAEAIGQHITLIVPPELRAEEEQVLARLRRGEKVDHFETERRAKNGATVCVSLSVSPIRNAHGELIGASKVARDITERKRAESELRTSEQYRRAVLDSMPECVKVLDRNGTVLQMNPAGLRMLEAESPEQVLGKCVYEFIREEDRDAFRAVNEGIFQGASGGRLEFVVTGLKGTELVLETDVVPLYASGNEAIGALSVTRDITGRKQAEMRDAFLLRLDDSIRLLQDAAVLTGTAARALAEYLAIDRCFYAEIDPDSGTCNITGDYARIAPSIIGQDALGAFGSECLSVLSSGAVHVMETGIRTGCHASGISAAVTVPLVKAGRLVAALAVHNALPRKWRPDEIEIVRLVANRCWESIERARVERELREREQEFRTLANAIPNLVWMARPDGHIFWYNRRWYDYTGTTPEVMEGGGWQSLHDPALLPAVLERWRASLSTGEPFEMVFPLKRADGVFRSFLTRVEPVRDARGRILRWFGTNTDITDQQEAERRERKARQTAEVLTNVAPVLAAELDPQKLTQKITDIATQAVRGQMGALFRPFIDDRGESYVLYTLSGVPREAFAKFPMPRDTHVFGPVFRGERAVRSDDITKDPLYGKNPPYWGMPEGHPPVKSFLAVPVRSRTGDVLGGLFFGHSEVAVFTEEAEAIATGIAAQAAIALDNASLFEQTARSGEALLISNEELRRLNHDLNQFAFSASHDLREPLRMISIYSQLLARKLGGELDEESEEFLAYILKGTSRMEALVRDLLAYAQAAGPAGSHPPVADANRALSQAFANLATAIEETAANITFSTLPVVRIPEVYLTQIFQNLIGNSLKYRRDDAVNIHIAAIQREGEWEFAVCDNGIGIEEEYKEHIFGVFKRLHTSDEYPGTGIGLAICQRIVQRAGGRIWVESRFGQGSTFFFTLPAAG